MASAVLFPALYKNIRRKNLSVAEALKENRWILGIAHDLTPTILHEFFAFWSIIAEQRICLNTGQEDTIIWTQTSGGVYTAKSEYNLQFMGGIHSTFPCPPGCHQRSKLLPGLCYKTGSGLQIACNAEAGRMNIYVSYSSGT